MRTKKTNNGDLFFYKDVVSNLGAVVFIVDLDSLEYIWSNNEYYDMFGYQEDEILMNIMEFAENYFHPNDKSIVKELVDAFRDNKEISWSGVCRIKHKEGHWIWIYTQCVVWMRNAAGNPTQLLGIVTNATENFKTKKQIKELVKERLLEYNTHKISKLTLREVEIMCLIVSGKTYVEIAKLLSIQPDTVNKHRKSILKKLALRNIASLVSYATELGLA